MSEKDCTCIYDKQLRVPIHDKRGIIEERDINIHISDYCDALQIKLRAVGDFLFNYTEKVDLGDFEVMKTVQKLDINFNEFKNDLVEMLDQYEKREMFLKCEVHDKKCTLVFYFKSKIKSIIYLTLDLMITNQRDIYNEMINNLQRVHGINERQKVQIKSYQMNISSQNQQIHSLTLQQKKLKYSFLNDLKLIDDSFNMKLKEIESIIVKKICVIHERLLKLHREVERIKKETVQKSDSTARLLRTIENLRLEADQSSNVIIELRKQNTAFKSLKESDEKLIVELNKRIKEQDSLLVDLQQKNEELHRDLEKTTMFIAQKQQVNDELAKDLLKANQMLVNFNNHYDAKVRQIEELQNESRAKDQMLKTEKVRMMELMSEFEEYKRCFNSEVERQLKNELIEYTNKVQEHEETIRRTNKINALLSEKLNGLQLNPFQQ